MVHPPRHDHPWFAAEWPTSREAVTAWTDQTMLVADNTSNTTTLLALTPQPDGQMRVDPVPMPVNPAREAFGFGYGGGTPAVTYRAILRLVLEDSIADALGQLTFDPDINKNGPVSQLWAEISTSRSGPLRLAWPQVQQWVRAAVDAVRNREKPTTA